MKERTRKVQKKSREKTKHLKFRKKTPGTQKKNPRSYKMRVSGILEANSGSFITNASEFSFLLLGDYTINAATNAKMA